MAKGSGRTSAKPAEPRGAAAAKAVGLHAVVVLLLLAVSTAIVFSAPLQVSAMQVYKWVPVAYVVFVGVHVLWTRRVRSTTRRKP